MNSLPLAGGWWGWKWKEEEAVDGGGCAKRGESSRQAGGLCWARGEVYKGLRGTESSERTVTNCHLQRNTRFRPHNNPALV